MEQSIIFNEYLMKSLISSNFSGRPLEKGQSLNLLFEIFMGSLHQDVFSHTVIQSFWDEDTLGAVRIKLNTFLYFTFLPAIVLNEYERKYFLKPELAVEHFTSKRQKRSFKM